MTTKLKSAFILLVFVLVSANMFAQRNFVLWLPVTDAYADSDVLDEIESLSAIDRNWCDYLTNPEVDFGEKLAFVARIAKNNLYLSLEEQSIEKNFKVFNAYILNKYNLSKPDYSKISGYDGALLLLFNQANHEFGESGDTLILKNIAKNNPKSLSLNLLDVGLRIYYTTIYDNTSNKRLFKALTKIDGNFDKFDKDLRLQAAQSMADNLNKLNPCTMPRSEPQSLVCQCIFDDNDVPVPFKQRVKCINESQDVYRNKIQATYNEIINSKNEFWRYYSIDDYQAFIAAAMKWYEAELKYISTLDYGDRKKTDALQIVHREMLLRKLYNMHYVGPLGAAGVNLYRYYILEQDPQALDNYPNFVEVEDYEESNEGILIYQEKLNEIMNAKFAKLGGNDSEVLKNAQDAWNEVNIAQQKFKEGRRKWDVTKLNRNEYLAPHLDFTMDRARMLAVYGMTPNEIEEGNPFYQNELFLYLNLVRK